MGGIETEGELNKEIREQQLVPCIAGVEPREVEDVEKQRRIRNVGIRYLSTII